MLPLKDNIPMRRFPAVTVAIIGINLGVFFLLQGVQLSWSGASVDHTTVLEYGVIPFEVTHPGEEVPGDPDQPSTWLTLITSMFMHGGLLHLFGNMLFLWIFGGNIEDSMGRVRFVAFYLAAGIAATLMQVAIGPDSTVPSIGASGAVAGVLGAYAILYPRARVVTLIFIVFLFTVIELPALLVLGGWLLLQLYGGATDLAQPVQGGGGVAYFAHVGGFLFGMIVIKLIANRVHEDYESAGRIPVY